MPQPEFVSPDAVAPASGPPDAAPPRLGRYLLGPELRRDAAGVAHEATDTRDGRTVALTVLAVPPGLSPERRRDLAERFAREARAVSQLAHPALAAPADFGHAEDGRPFLVTERLHGETLRARLQREGPLLASEALPLLTRIADALQYAHGRGVLHRDVTPDAIFLCADGTAKLTDFGVARVYAEDGLTRSVIGPPAYLSPEQLGGAALDGRSDVFSLAVCAAEALSGQRPFDADDIPSVIHRVLHRPPQLGGIGSRPLRRALERALAKSPAARTPSAGALASALRQAAPPFVFAPPAPARRSAPAFGEAAPWGVAAGAGALALLALCALPVALRHHTAATAPVTAATSGAAGADATRLAAGPVAHAGPGRSPGGASDPGEGWIVETTPPPPLSPRPRPARAAAGVLQQLRDETLMPPPLPVARPRARPAAASRPAPAAPPATPDAAPPPEAPAGRDAPETIPADAALYGMGGANGAGRLEPPHLVGHTDPVTPPGARGAAGTARLLVSVNPDGGVADARVVRSSGDSALDDAAIATVLHWQYAPATHDGRPVSANIAETVTFGPH